MAEPGRDPLEESLLDAPSDALDGNAAPANVKLELKALSLLSAPVIVQLGALYAIIVVNQYFIGHLGAAPLAAAAIGNTVRAHVVGSAHAVLSPSEDWQLHSNMQQLEAFIAVLCMATCVTAVVQFLLVLSSRRFDGSRYCGITSSRRREP